MPCNNRIICYIFVAFGLSGCANMDPQQAVTAFTTGLAGGAAIYANGANYVQQPVYRPVYMQPVAPPGGTWNLMRESTAGQIKYCVYTNNAVHTISMHLTCPAYTY